MYIYIHHKKRSVSNFVKYKSSMVITCQEKGAYLEEKGC